MSEERPRFRAALNWDNAVTEDEFIELRVRALCQYYRIPYESGCEQIRRALQRGDQKIFRKGDSLARARKDQPKKLKIKLISRRGTRVNAGGLCGECGRAYDTVWLYKESNQGQISLCVCCKPKVLQRSFGGSHFPRRKVLNGGCFERNRRKF